MSASNTQSSPRSNLESSPPPSTSNIHNGSNNQDNRGIVGNGCRNIVLSGNVGCPIIFILTKPEDENELDRLLDKLRDCFILGVPYGPSNAPPECHPGTHITSCNCIRERMSNPESSPQSHIQCSNIIDNSFANTFVNYAAPEDGNELDNLLYFSISEDALHNSFHAPPKCHPGTRNTACNAIIEWMSDPAGSPLLWLNGPAGIGKSVIAETISSDQTLVVATFFFSTSSDKSTATLVPTLAWQLAKNVPETKAHIIGALKRDRLLMKRKLEHQFDQLIVQPLKNCTSTRLFMVIDGVDECVDENIEFLKILIRAGEEGSLPLHFLICSRPEPRIRAILETTDDSMPQLATNFTNFDSDIPQSSSLSSPDWDTFYGPVLI